MRKLPIDVSSFSIMRSEDYVYIDKTEHIYNLITRGRLYFLARPRRFGKSLLISTLEELYLGNRELFKGLWIDTNSNYQWQEYPVIRLDFSRISGTAPQEFQHSLMRTLDKIGLAHNIDLSLDTSLSTKLETLIERLFQLKNNRVAVLIDEYDYPLVSNITDIKVAQEYQKIIKGFFTTLKGLDKYLSIVFVTGVSKFAKTSVFSGMNNLNDISFKPEVAALLGYTEEEIEYYLHKYIQAYADAHTVPYQDTIQEMRAWYNGYRFSTDPLKVYNPFSILYFLHDKNMTNYWFKSGTPTFLIKLLQEKKVMPEEIEAMKLTSDDLEPNDIDNIKLGPLLVQTGYLTFADYNKLTGIYTLTYPNRETRQSFNNYVLSMLANTTVATIKEGCLLLINALNAVDIPAFCSALQSIFAHISYQQLIYADESLYHALFQLLGILLGIYIESEVSTNKGRIDMVLQTKTNIFIFEIKHDVTAQVALQQIEDRKYYQKYLIHNKKIVLVGISFNQVDNKLSIESAFKEYA